MALTSYVMQPTPGSDLRRYASAELQKIEKSIGSIIIDSTDIRAALEAAQDDIVDLQAAEVVTDSRLDALEAFQTANTQVVGTWTPFVFGGTSAGVGTYTLQEGFYLKQGRIVLAHARVRWTAHTGTGVLKAGGLPFTSANNGSAANYWTNAVWSDSEARISLLYPNSTTTDFYNMPHSITQTTLPAAATLIYSQYYYTIP